MVRFLEVERVALLFQILLLPTKTICSCCLHQHLCIFGSQCRQERPAVYPAVDSKYTTPLVFCVAQKVIFSSAVDVWSHVDLIV